MNTSWIFTDFGIISKNSDEVAFVIGEDGNSIIQISSPKKFSIPLIKSIGGDYKFFQDYLFRKVREVGMRVSRAIIYLNPVYSGIGFGVTGFSDGLVVLWFCEICLLSYCGGEDICLFCGDSDSLNRIGREVSPCGGLLIIWNEVEIC